MKMFAMKVITKRWEFGYQELFDGSLSIKDYFNPLVDLDLGPGISGHLPTSGNSGSVCVLEGNDGSRVRIPRRANFLS